MLEIREDRSCEMDTSPSRKLVLAGSFVVKEVSLPKLIYYKWSSTYNGVLSPLTGVLLADRVCVCVEVLADSL